MFCNTTRLNSARTSREDAVAGLFNGGSSLFWRENSALSSYSRAKFCVTAMSCFVSPPSTADFVYRSVAKAAKRTQRNRTKTSVPRSVICQRKLSFESGSLDGRVLPPSTRPIIAIPSWSCSAEDSGLRQRRLIGGDHVNL